MITDVSMAPISLTLVLKLKQHVSPKLSNNHLQDYAVVCDMRGTSVLEKGKTSSLHQESSHYSSVVQTLV
jgi:hypothetical protein